MHRTNTCRALRSPHVQMVAATSVQQGRGKVFADAAVGKHKLRLSGGAACYSAASYLTACSICTPLIRLTAAADPSAAQRALREATVKRTVLAAESALQ